MSMTTTDWREYKSGAYTYRIRAKYGLHKIGSQEPYLSLTADLEDRPARGGRWREAGGGAMHREIARHFPELRDLIPWHLTSVKSGPMHYLANAMYHYDQGETDFFKSTIVFGALPDDERRLRECRSENRAEERACIGKWLKDRLPKLMKRFRAVLKEHGIKP
jgi:hypothetical protein